MIKRDRQLDLFDSYIRNQVLLERYKTNQINKVSRDLRTLQRVLLESIYNPDLFESESIRKIEKLIRLVKDRISPVFVGISETIEQEWTELAISQAEFEAETIALVKTAVLTIPTAKAAYDAALRNPIAATGQLLKSFVKDWTLNEIEKVGNEIRKGYATGLTNQQLVQNIIGTEKLKYKDGILETTRRNALSVVRTAIQHIANSAKSETWAENSDIVKGYIWVSTLDGRTSQICKSLDGERFDLGKGPLPPIHPNCRSTTIADLGDEWNWYKERAAMGKPVSADLTYYEWLKRQSEDFQLETLGPIRFKLFKDGGLTEKQFAALNISSSFEPLTLDEMRKRNPAAFKKAGL